MNDVTSNYLKALVITLAEKLDLVDTEGKFIYDLDSFLSSLPSYEGKFLSSVISDIEQRLDNYFFDNQKYILYEIQSSGFNVISCGNCGEVLLHKIDTTDDIYCGYCKTEMLKSDCSDLHY